MQRHVSGNLRDPPVELIAVGNAVDRRAGRRFRILGLFEIWGRIPCSPRSPEDRKRESLSNLLCVDPEATWKPFSLITVNPALPHTGTSRRAVTSVAPIVLYLIRSLAAAQKFTGLSTEGGRLPDAVLFSISGLRLYRLRTARARRLRHANVQAALTLSRTFYFSNNHSGSLVR